MTKSKKELMPMVDTTAGTLIPKSKRESLVTWFELYMGVEVGDPESNTFRAKKRDVQQFVDFLQTSAGTDHPDQWTKAITESFLRYLYKQRDLAAATVNRALATLKQVAGWIHLRLDTTSALHEPQNGLCVGADLMIGLEPISVRPGCRSFVAPLLVGTMLGVTTTSVAQDFLIKDFQVGEHGGISVSHGSDTNGYYILQRGNSVSGISVAADLKLGQVLEGMLGAAAGVNAIEFFNVLRVDLDTPRDSDLDGIDDAFELQQDMDPLDASDFMKDPDGDGFGNIYEYTHKTNPNDETSVPAAMLYVDVAAAPDGAGSAGAPLDTIQAALDVAGTYDIIQVANGIYTGTGNINLDFFGKPVMLISENGSNSCIIDCEGSGRGFFFHNGEDARSVVCGFTIQNGDVDGGGAGIYNLSSSPTVANCMFSSNSAIMGGGMYNDASSPNVVNCAFDFNSATDGGGMYNDDSASTVVTGCSFFANSATNGGGMYNVDLASPSVADCSFTENRAAAGRGGGMFNSGTLTIDHTLFSSNVTTSGPPFSTSGPPGRTTGRSGGPGGGIYNGGHLELNHCTIRGNNTDGEGQTFVSGVIIGHSGSDGGGIANDGTMTINDSSILDNVTGRGDKSTGVTGGKGGDGGGVYNSGWLLLNHSIVAGNLTGNGGIDTVFSGGDGGKGGGIYNGGIVTLTNCIIETNTAGDAGGSGEGRVSPPPNDGSGGGIYNTSNSTMRLFNSTVVGNRTLPVGALEPSVSAPRRRGAGAGIYSEGTFTIDGSTIAFNIGDGFGGGVFVSPSNSVIRNSILWGNEPGQIHGEVLVTYSCIEKGYPGTMNISSDPHMWIDGHLRSNSPCIDSGFDLVGPGVDRDGDMRPVGLGVDMGSDEYVDTDASGLPDWFEAQYDVDADDDGDGLTTGMEYTHGTDPAVMDTDRDGFSDGWELTNGLNPLVRSDAVVDTDGDGYGLIYEWVYGTDAEDAGSFPAPTIHADASASPIGDGSPLAPFDSIQLALNAANDYDIIQLADGMYTGTNNINIDFLGKPVMLISTNGPNSCIIDCEGSGRGFLFHSGEDARSVVRGLSIINGDFYNGGGILNRSSSPSVEYCILRDNMANSGAAMYNDLSSPIVKHCFIQGNSAFLGGGGMYNVVSDPTVVNCAFSSNSVDIDGPGIFNLLSEPKVFNCTFSESSTRLTFDTSNEIFNDSSSPILVNCIIWSTVATGSTSKIYNQGPSNPDVTYSCIQGGYIGEGNINQDPLFVAPHDPAGPDGLLGTPDDGLQLQSGSPCIDTGTPSGAPALDILRMDRPKDVGFDMGAYEAPSAAVPAESIISF